MIAREPWFEREFPVGLTPDLIPLIGERLRGTAPRLNDRVKDLPTDLVTRRSGATWSIQENVGHLLDMESLWKQRLEDLAHRRPDLTAADLQNRRTHDANHHAARLGSLLHDFRIARLKFVQELELFDEPALGFAALHPRLKKPMNAVDLAFFVAEHDDYHLARITELIRASQSNSVDNALSAV